MGKYYVVVKGRCKRYSVFSDWESCKGCVDKFPGALFKGFKTKEEAKDYVKKNLSLEKSLRGGDVALNTRLHNMEKVNAYYSHLKLMKAGTRGENIVAAYLSAAKIKYTSQYKVQYNKYNHIFDFVIRNSKGIVAFIEYDGEQHFRAVEEFGGVREFEKRRFLDSQKEVYCKEKGKPLIRIAYNESHLVKEILVSKLFPLLY